MLASIVIPIHNTSTQDRSGMVSDLIRSIPARTDIEVILVDDHSPHPYRLDTGDPLFRIIEISNDKAEKYAGTARNVGVRAAVGEFVIFADSDDLLDTEAFERVLDDISRANEDVILYKTASFGDGPDRHVNINNGSRLVAESGDPLGSLAWYGSPVGLCIRTKFLTGHDILFPELRISEDLTFSARLAAARPTTRVLDIPAYLIRSHESLVGGGPRPDIFRNVLAATRLANQALAETGMSSKQVSMLRPIREYARNYPLIAVVALCRAIVCREPILPRRLRR